MPWLIFFSAVFLLLGYILSRLLHNKEDALPPGVKALPIVKGIPILGIFPQIIPPLYDYLMNLREKYGNIFTIQFGMRKIVVLNDFQMIKRTIKDNGDNFAGRWKAKLGTIISKESGILFIDGEKWHKQRTFLLKVLRDFGFGKSRSNEIVQGECKHLIEELDNLQGAETDFMTLIPIYTANIISEFIMSKNFQRTDPKIKSIENLMYEITKKQDFAFLFHLLFPIFDDSEIITRFNIWITSRKKLFCTALELFDEELKEHLKSLDFNSEGNDLMDRFLIEQRRLIDKDGTPESFTDHQLKFMTLELFGAGYETTSTTLGWAMLFMSKYPDVQKKVHDEIIENIGSERLPTMNDKKSFIYTQAVMDEILRLSSVVPLSLLHRTFMDTSLDGYFIPKNSIIFINLYACHRDPITWKKPFEFYPDHFLEETGDGILKHLPREELIPFGIGKRQCIGESLARMEYLIFFVAILQRFRVRFSENITEKEYNDAVRGNEGAIRFSKIQNYIFERY